MSQENRKNPINTRTALCVLLMLVGLVSTNCRPTQLRDGDIVFHTSTTSQSLAIQKATHSKYSHMGIIFHWNGRPFVFEAVGPVKFTPLENWIKRGQGKRYVVKRLKKANTILTRSAIEKLKGAAVAFEGKPYDFAFGWSDDRIYCSELVWKIYDRGLGIQLGEIRTLREFDLSDPVVKAKLKERYGEKTPLDEPVISPQSIFESNLLE